MAKRVVGSLVYEIEGDDSKYTNVIKRADKSSQDFAKQVKKTGDEVETSSKKSSNSVGGLADSFKKLGTYVASYLGARVISGFFSSAIKASEDQQVADEKLANALSNVKTAREGDYELLKQQASALQEVTRFADDEIQASQALSATFQLNGREIEKLTPRILDMAEAMTKNSDNSMDLQGATIAVGKAMTSGIGILSRYGVTFTDAQKKAFELADQTEKLNILTNVLDDNFKGTAETVGKTFAGRVEILKNRFGELKEDIGFALIPTLDFLLTSVDNNTKGVTGNIDRVNAWAKTIYRVVNFIIALGKSALLAVTSIFAFGEAIFEVNKLSLSFIFDQFKNLFNLLKNGVSGIVKLLGGDFDGAMESFKKSISFNLDETKKSLNSLVFNTKSNVSELSRQWDSMGESMTRAVDLKDFKEVTQAQVSAYRDMLNNGSNLNNKNSKELEKLKENAKKLQDALTDLGDKGSEAVRELKNQNIKDLEEIDKKIDELKKNLKELREEYDKSIASEDKTIAERIVEEKANIEELKKKIAEARSQKEPDQTSIAEMESELAKRQLALQATEPLQKTLEPQITEATRRAGLTDLERAVEDYNARKIQIQLDYEQKKKELEDKLALEEQNKQETIELLADKQEQINAIIELGNQRFKDLADKRVKITEDEVNKQIQYYNKLAQAIANSKSAKTTAELGTVKYSSGGYVQTGGEVHAGEYVIPAYMVAKYGGLIKALEGIRSGSVNSNTINNNITMNNAINEQIDMDAVLKNMSFELNK